MLPNLICHLIRRTVKRHTHIYIISAIATLVTLLAACGPQGNDFRLEGSFRDMQAGELYVYNLEGRDAKFDTLTIQEGRFLYKGQVTTTTPFILLFPNGVEQVIFVSPGADLAYEATANDLKNYVVNGTDENKLMNKFRREAYTLNEAAVQALARTYINEHSESLVAIYLLDRYFVQSSSTSLDLLAALIDTVKSHHPSDRYLTDIEQRVKYQRQSIVGKKVPNINLRDRNNKTSKLWKKDTKTADKDKKDKPAESAKSKESKAAKNYTLLVFWATWSISGYDTLWKIRTCHDDYKEGGKLRIIAVSLDVERYRWEESTCQDSTRNIEHYCDGRCFESDDIRRLGVDRVPSFILVDSDHKIVERGTDVADLTKVVEKYVPKDERPQR